MTNIDINKIERVSRDIFMQPAGAEIISKTSKPAEIVKESKKTITEPATNDKAKKGIYDDVDFKGAIKSVNELVSSINNKVAFSIDEESQQRIIKVFDRDTGDIIRQIPKEDMVRLLVKLKEIQGIIFHKKA